MDIPQIQYLKKYIHTLYVIHEPRVREREGGGRDMKMGCSYVTLFRVVHASTSSVFFRKPNQPTGGQRTLKTDRMTPLRAISCVLRWKITGLGLIAAYSSRPVSPLTFCGAIKRKEKKNYDALSTQLNHAIFPVHRSFNRLVSLLPPKRFFFLLWTPPGRHERRGSRAWEPVFYSPSTK